MSEYTYNAFISYRHKDLDIAVAKAVHRQLETYRIPRQIQKITGRKKMDKVFRDQDELPLLSDLGKGIEQALEGSEWLIVICTPDLPLSKWCMAEIDYFISLGRQDRILTVLAAGEPEVSFPEQLRYTFVNGEQTEQEPLAADVRGDSIADSLKKIKREKLRLLAPILGVGYDDLRRRQRERFLRTVAGVSVTAALVSAGAGIYVLNQNRLLDEQRMLAQEQRDQALISQSRFLAELSAAELAKGDRVTAALLALEALPKDLDHPDRPLVEEAAAALRNTETLAISTGFQPVFTVEPESGVHAFAGLFRYTRSYQLYEDTLITVADSAIYLHSVSNGELLGEVPLDPLKERPEAVVFAPVMAQVYLIYEDHFQIAYPTKGTFSEDIPLAYEGYFSPRGGVGWSSGNVFIYGFADTGESWGNKNRTDPDQLAASMEAESPFTCAVVGSGSTAYSYMLATGHEADREKTVDTVRIWDLSAGTFLRSLPVRDEIRSLEFSSNRLVLAAVPKTGPVSLWNPTTGQLLYEINEDEAAKTEGYQALEARFSPDSSMLAVCYENGIVRLYDVATGDMLHDMQSPGITLKNVGWSADGTELLSAAGDQNAYLYDAATGELKSRLDSFGDLLEAVFLNSDTILLEHADGSLHIFARRDEGENPGAVSLTGESLLWDILIDPDGSRAVSSTREGHLHVYDTATGDELLADQYPDITATGVDQIRTMSWQKDGSGRVLIQAVNEAVIWDPATGDWELSVIPGQVGDYVSEIHYLSGNADGTRLVFNTVADWVHIHDTENGAEQVVFRHNPDSPEGINHVYPLWSPVDADRLLTYRTRDDDPENLVHIWNSKGEKQISINIGGDPVIEAAWSPDGRYILCADAAGRMRIYSAADGTLAEELAEHPYSPRYCTWSPDGERIAFLADTTSAWIWNRQSGSIVRIRKPESTAGNDRALPSWSPDSTMVYLYGSIYNAVSGTAVMTLPDHAPFSLPAQWSPDSSGILLVQNRYTARFWKIRPVSELAAEARSRLDGRVLTADERERFFLD